MSDSKDASVLAIDQLRKLRRLPVRLQREKSRSDEAITGLVQGVLLIALATGVAYYNLFWDPNKAKDWVGVAVAGVIAAFGVWRIVLAIRVTFASRVRETIVEIDSEKVTLGQPVRVCLRQEGPVTLNRLRATVECVQITTKYHRDSQDSTKTRTETIEKVVHEHRLVDAATLTIPAEEFWEHTVEFTLPANARPSSDGDESLAGDSESSDPSGDSLADEESSTGAKSGDDDEQDLADSVWKLHVRGDVQQWPNFDHPFVLRVVSAN